MYITVHKWRANIFSQETKSDTDMFFQSTLSVNVSGRRKILLGMSGMGMGMFNLLFHYNLLKFASARVATAP